MKRIHGGQSVTQPLSRPLATEARRAKPGQMARVDSKPWVAAERNGGTQTKANASGGYRPHPQTPRKGSAGEVELTTLGDARGLHALGDARALISAALPKLFMGSPGTEPSQGALEDLQGALDGLRAAGAGAGTPEGVEPMFAALARIDDLPERAEPATRQVSDAAVALLQHRLEAALEAIGPGRDGAALITLYGHGAVLDKTIDTLRTGAATRVLVYHEVRHHGLPNAASLPAELRETAGEHAKALVHGERDIAQLRLKIQHTLAKVPGFVPSLGCLRFDSALAEGLSHANPEAVNRAGLLMRALLVAHRDLAQSAKGQHMRSAAERLEVHARAVLADPASYRLHSLENVIVERTSGKLSGLSDQVQPTRGWVEWSTQAKGEHQRQTDSIVFDAALLDAALPGSTLRRMTTV